MESISVCVRIRPRNLSKEEESIWKVEDNSILNFKSKEIFSYDKIIEADQTNERLFNENIKKSIEKVLNGINVTIFAYGQTSTGKTYTMKGTNNNLNGIIPLSIKEILNSLQEEEKESNGGLKYTVKVSYLEIYNETVNDLLDATKKNLEIRESLQRGVFVNNLTETPITSLEKGMQLLKQGENIRVFAETKLNEKSSRSHVILRLSLEMIRKVEGGKTKTLQSQLNLIDLAGSENVSKAKTEGIRMKEGSNINKSLLALSNVIQKLSNSPKSFVNYRDSKLTRLLQPALSGNSKTMIICTITESIQNYSETLNTLHFGIKAKNIKTSIKVNEFLDEKIKMTQENSQLKSKIKNLEDLIVKEKTTDSHLIINKNHSDSISQLEKEVLLLKKILIKNEEITEADVNSEIMSQTSHNNFYNTLSNQLNMTATKKRNSSMFMSSGKKMTDSARKIYKDSNYSNYGDNNNFNDPNEMNSNSVFRRCMTDMKMNNFAPSIYSSNNNTNANINNYLMNSQQKIKYPANNFTNNFNLNSAYKGQRENNFNQNLNQNFMTNNLDPDNDFLYPGQNDNTFQLLKENDDLRKNIFDLRKNFLETVQNKDTQIKSLNFYLQSTNENCEKLIREAEENYMNLKLNFDRTNEEFLNKETEIKNLTQTIRGLEANTSFYKEEIIRVNNEMKNLTEIYKSDKMFKELEMKYNEVSSSHENLIINYENDKTIFNDLKNSNEKLKNENSNTKMQLENYKSENLSFKTQYDVMKKNTDLYYNENSKLKNDIESYKNENISLKDKVNKLKSELNQLQKDKKNINEKNEKNEKNSNTNISKEFDIKISQLTSQISKLESENQEYKTNLIKIEQTQILEYQKLLDESFNKITELQNENEISIQKILYLEKVIKLNNENYSINLLNASNSRGTPLKEKNQFSIKTSKTILNSKTNTEKNVSQFSFNEIKENSQFNLIPDLPLNEDCNIENLENNDTLNNSLISPNGKDFIGKKRKYLTRVYQNIIDKNLNTKVNENNNVNIKSENNINVAIKEEKENVKDIYFSTYEM